MREERGVSRQVLETLTVCAAWAAFVTVTGVAIWTIVRVFDWLVRA